jgi:hypothetical protein
MEFSNALVDTNVLAAHKKNKKKVRTGPNPLSGIGSRVQPIASHPSNGRVLPIQAISTPGHWRAKKMTTAEMAIEEEKAVVVMLCK